MLERWNLVQLNCGDNAKHNGAGFVDTSKIFAVQCVVSYGTELDRVYHCNSGFIIFIETGVSKLNLGLPCPDIMP